jgi:hypothetical protein
MAAPAWPISASSRTRHRPDRPADARALVPHVRIPPGRVERREHAHHADRDAAAHAQKRYFTFPREEKYSLASPTLLSRTTGSRDGDDVRSLACTAGNEREPIVSRLARRLVPSRRPVGAGGDDRNQAGAALVRATRRGKAPFMAIDGFSAETLSALLAALRGESFRWSGSHRLLAACA